jgi:hypothetical protein
LLFKYQDEANESRNNMAARKEEALIYIYERVTDVLCSTAICADRLFHTIATKYNEEIVWDYIGPSYFRLSSMAEWFPLSTNFLLKARKLTIAQYH